MNFITLNMVQEWATVTAMAVVINPNGTVTILDKDGAPVLTHTADDFARHVDAPRLTSGAVTLSAPGYDALGHVLLRAFEQAATGKGAQRHASDGVAFDEQPMQWIANAVGPGFLLGQVMKKAHEAQTLPRDAAVRELLGAINYLAGAVIYLEARNNG